MLMYARTYVCLQYLNGQLVTDFTGEYDILVIMEIAKTMQNRE